MPSIALDCVCASRSTLSSGHVAPTTAAGYGRWTTTYGNQPPTKPDTVAGPPPMGISLPRSRTLSLETPLWGAPASFSPEVSGGSVGGRLSDGGGSNGATYEGIMWDGRKRITITTSRRIISRDFYKVLRKWTEGVYGQCATAGTAEPKQKPASIDSSEVRAVRGRFRRRRPPGTYTPPRRSQTARSDF
jgi:hypothetical protein